MLRPLPRFSFRILMFALLSIANAEAWEIGIKFGDSAEFDHDSIVADLKADPRNSQPAYKALLAVIAAYDSGDEAAAHDKYEKIANGDCRRMSTWRNVTSFDRGCKFLEMKANETPETLEAREKAIEKAHQDALLVAQREAAEKELSKKNAAAIAEAKSEEAEMTCQLETEKCRSDRYKNCAFGIQWGAEIKLENTKLVPSTPCTFNSKKYHRIATASDSIAAEKVTWEWPDDLLNVSSCGTDIHIPLIQFNGISFALGPVSKPGENLIVIGNQFVGFWKKLGSVSEDELMLAKAELRKKYGDPKGPNDCKTYGDKEYEIYTFGTGEEIEVILARVKFQSLYYADRAFVRVVNLKSLKQAIESAQQSAKTKESKLNEQKMNVLKERMKGL